MNIGYDHAENELNTALSEKSPHNVLNNSPVLIKDSSTAIQIAEPILYSIYGKENITKQRPYKIYFINYYWVIMGMLPFNSKGGTFLIIFDARDCKIIKLTHGK